MGGNLPDMANTEHLTVRLTYSRELDDASRNHRNPSWLEAVLDPGRRGDLVVAPVENDRLFLAESLGYLPPENVRRYFVSGLNQQFDGGLLHQVIIDFEDSWKDGHIGTYTYWRPYDKDKVPQGIKPGEKGYMYSDSGYDVLSGPVLISDAPATEYVVEDRAGKFVPISQKWIESLIMSARKSAETIETLNPDMFVWPDLEKAEKLVEASKRYDLVGLIRTARVDCESLIALGPKRHTERLRQRSTFTGTPRYVVELSGDLPLSYVAGVEEYDSGVYALLRDRGHPGVDPEVFPFSLESISNQSVAELMKHFAGKGFDLDYLNKHMKVRKLE